MAHSLPPGEQVILETREPYITARHPVRETTFFLCRQRLRGPAEWHANLPSGCSTITIDSNLSASWKPCESLKA